MLGYLWFVLLAAFIVLLVLADDGAWEWDANASMIAAMTGR